MVILDYENGNLRYNVLGKMPKPRAGTSDCVTAEIDRGAPIKVRGPARGEGYNVNWLM
jgi:hypothetical protein